MHESAVSSSDTIKHKKGPKVLNLSKVFTEWGIYIKDVRDLALEHNAATREAIRLRKSSSLSAPKAALVKASMSDPTTIIQLFNTKVAKRKRVECILTKIEISKYYDVLNRRFSINLIVKVRCSKPKG